jgi:hypothetical protein
MIAGTEKPNGTGRSGRRPRHDVHLLEGTKLLREWRGVMHEVTVIDGGYEHQGRRYRSLSAVARAITGTQWSGPLFFGLRKTGRPCLARLPKGSLRARLAREGLFGTLKGKSATGVRSPARAGRP